MELQKETKPFLPREKRWYDDACGTALALELVGERWSLLIVRELMFGGRRFSDLRGGLPGISAKVLTERLESLEAVGIVTRTQVTSPVPARLYALTPWGYQASRAIQELGRWAAASRLHDPTLPLSAASLMMSFTTMFDATRAADLAAVIGFRIGNDDFRAEIGEGKLSIVRGATEDADLRIAAPDAMQIAAAVYGEVPFAQLPQVTVTGDLALANRFITLFPLPARIG